MLLLFSILILSCSKDSDLFSDTIEEQIVNEKNTTGVSSNGFQPVDDEYTINAINTAFLLAVLSNDSIPENVVVDIVQTTAPQDGELTINEDNVLSYTPTIDDNKGSGDVVTDSFTYTVEITNGDVTQQKQASVTVKTQYSDSDKDMGALKAFPSAFGPGSIATGGRGKALAIVNTLDPYAALTHHARSGSNDEYYTGGFFTALQEANVGYIVFDVSGDMHLGDIGRGWYDGYKGVNNKTVFGQSAPKGGITITDRSLRFDGSTGDNKNLIFRYLRSRPIYDRNGVVTSEDDAFTWGLLFYGGEDIIVDHCSLSFAQDKAIGAYITEKHAANGTGLRNLTFQHNFIQDSNTGAYVEINPNREGDPENFVDAISWHSNVFSSVNRTPNLAFNGRAEKINNVIHNTPSKNSITYHSLLLNSVGNYYQRQGTTPDKIRLDRDATSGNPLVYTALNVFNGTVGGVDVNLQGISSEDNSTMWSLQDASISAPSVYFTQTEHSFGFPNPVNVLSPFEAFDNLVSNGDVGAFKYLDDNGYVQTYRDSFDSSQLSIVQNNSYYQPKNVSNWVLPEIPHNTRPDSYDTDKDGMADAWEIRIFGNLEQSYRGDFDGDGYTNIEEFMYQVDFD
ncbi:Ig-like domain-containing protein [Flagellimonas profundi]|uniref:Pectate lyase C n=1 Tax=Flagellimonas profundi TaxID=2915620 RepID=A0ABS3FBJ2_9FLAO|nr:Ig-like domain-containing protein [Allomuricauda profundi]MBO0340528.1 hypothetical protein [Allomuricauda profundi]